MDHHHLYAEYTTSPRWRALVTRARHTNAQRDADEASLGFASPDGSAFLQLRAGLDALSAGLCTENWDCIAEGFVILQQLEYALRPTLIAMHAQRYGTSADGPLRRKEPHADPSS